MFGNRKAIKEGWKLSGDQEDLILIKDGAMLAFEIKITTKNGLIFYLCLQRDQEVGALLLNTSVAKRTEKAHKITRHHDKQ